MKLYTADSYEALSRQAGNLIAAQILLKPDSVLGLATGSTPVGIYQRLIALNQRGDVDFSRVRTVNLDEYQGLSADHRQSYAYFMHQHLFDHINIDPANCHLPNGCCEDADGECRRYEALIRQLGGIDLQLLGMGHNGHIGFNEPAEAFVRNTNLVALQPRTLAANRRFFAETEEMPQRAFTMGIGTIMSARRILLVVSGQEKAKTLVEALCGPITPRIPASILQLHPDVTVVADTAALQGFEGETPWTRS